MSLEIKLKLMDNCKNLRIDARIPLDNLDLLVTSGIVVLLSESFTFIQLVYPQVCTDLVCCWYSELVYVQCLFGSSFIGPILRYLRTVPSTFGLSRQTTFDRITAFCFLLFFGGLIHTRPAEFCTRWEEPWREYKTFLQNQCKTSLKLWTFKLMNDFLLKETILYCCGPRDLFFSNPHRSK